MRRLVAITSLCLALPAFAGDLTPPSGTPGPTMKTLQQVEPRVVIDSSTTPGDADSLFKITASGSYYLPANLSISSGRGMLEIAASNVTVDFNGFRVQGLAGSIDGVFTTGAVSNITLRNGNFVSFGGDGIDTSSATAVKIEGTRVRSCGSAGIRAAADTVVHQCEVGANGSHGIIVGARSVVSDSVSAGSTAGNGLQVTGDGVRITGFTSMNNAGIGINLQSAFGARITDATVRANSGTGVTLTDRSVLEQSAICENGLIGVSMTGRARLQGCTISGNVSNGVSATGPALIERNQIDSNMGNGVYLYFTANAENSWAQVSHNTITNNGTELGEWGIHTASGTGQTLIDSNVLRENTGGIKSLGAFATILRNLSGPNYGPGFEFDAALTHAATIRTDLTLMTKPTDNYDGGYLIVFNP